MADHPDRRRLLLGFILVNLATGAAAGVLQMAVPLYALSLNATNTEIGLIKGVNGIGFLLLVIPAGFLVDRFGSKRLYLTGSIGCNLVAIAVSLAAAPGSLIFLMGAYGFFRSLSFIATNAAFFRSLQVMGVERVGWLNGSLTLGFSFVGPLLGGYLAKALNYPSIFHLVALLMPLPILLVMFNYRDSERGRTATTCDGTIGAQIRKFKELLMDRSIYRILLTEGVAGGCSGVFGVFIIVIVVRNLHLAPTVASALLILNGAVFIAAVFLAGPLVRRLASSTLYLASFAASSLGLLGLAFGGSLPVMGLASAILGMGLGLCQVINYSAIGAMKGEKGKITSLLATAGCTGMTVGPLAAGQLAEHFGNQLIFAFFVPLFLLLSFIVVATEPGREAENSCQSSVLTRVGEAE